jgi:hypothetical protein
MLSCRVEAVPLRRATVARLENARGRDRCSTPGRRVGSPASGLRVPACAGTWRYVSRSGIAINRTKRLRRRRHFRPVVSPCLTPVGLHAQTRRLRLPSRRVQSTAVCVVCQRVKCTSRRSARRPGARRCEPEWTIDLALGVRPKGVRAPIARQSEASASLWCRSLRMSLPMPACPRLPQMS